jgi:hypothetical protein
MVNFLVGATVSAAFGVGAARHPWMCLALGLFLWNWVPLIDHGEDARSLSVRGSCLAWVIGAPAGWYSRSVGAPRNRTRGADTRAGIPDLESRSPMSSATGGGAEVHRA